MLFSENRPFRRLGFAIDSNDVLQFANEVGGTIDGLIRLTCGGDDISNAGSIDGAIDFMQTGARSALTNSSSGQITGDIDLAGDDELINHGQIAGNVYCGASDKLVSAGTIKGAVTLGADDIIELSTGQATGGITASSNDIFDFNSNFTIGGQTIANFTGGTAANHDLIEFSATNFANFAALQSHMSQVGSDVDITLGTSTITLAGEQLSSLSARDFKFV